jgi:hypothetical protein
LKLPVLATLDIHSKKHRQNLYSALKSPGTRTDGQIRPYTGRTKMGFHNEMEDRHGRFHG